MRGRPTIRSQLPLPPPPPSQPTVDPSTLLIAALVPFLTSLGQQNIKHPSAVPAEPTVAPPGSPVPSTSTLEPAAPLSPPSTPTSNIRDCLLAFNVDSGIDLTRHEGALTHRDLTPDIVYEVSGVLSFMCCFNIFYRFPMSILLLYLGCRRERLSGISAFVVDGLLVRRPSLAFSSDVYSRPTKLVIDCILNCRVLYHARTE